MKKQNSQILIVVQIRYSQKSYDMLKSLIRLCDIYSLGFRVHVGRVGAITTSARIS